MRVVLLAYQKVPVQIAVVRVQTAFSLVGKAAKDVVEVLRALAALAIAVVAVIAVKVAAMAACVPVAMGVVILVVNPAPDVVIPARKHALVVALAAEGLSGIVTALNVKLSIVFAVNSDLNRISSLFLAGGMLRSSRHLFCFLLLFINSCANSFTSSTPF